MSATLRMMHERYGGVEGYLRDECGLAASDIDQIRQNLVTTESPIH